MLHSLFSFWMPIGLLPVVTYHCWNGSGMASLVSVLPTLCGNWWINTNLENFYKTAVEASVLFISHPRSEGTFCIYLGPLLKRVVLFLVQEQLSPAVCAASYPAEWEAFAENHQCRWVFTAYLHRHSQQRSGCPRSDTSVQLFADILLLLLLSYSRYAGHPVLATKNQRILLK